MKTKISRRAFVTQSAKVGAALGVTSVLGAGCCKAVMPPSAWKIGIYTRPWANFEYPKAFEAIAQAGFEYVGLMTTKSPNRLILSPQSTAEEAQKVAEEAKKHGLKIASVWGGGFDADKSVKQGVAALQNLISASAIAGSENLLIGGTGSEELFDQYYKVVAECCDFAQEKGVQLALKPHGGLNSTGPQCRGIVEKVNHPAFRMWYDPGNIYYYSDGSLNPVDDSPSVDGLVTGMCIKDYQHPKKVDVTPGTGQVDFPAVFEKLKTGGFISGPLLIETLASGDFDATLEEAKKARVFVEGLVG